MSTWLQCSPAKANSARRYRVQSGWRPITSGGTCGQGDNLGNKDGSNAPALHAPPRQREEASSATHGRNRSDHVSGRKDNSKLT